MIWRAYGHRHEVYEVCGWSRYDLLEAQAHCLGQQGFTWVKAHQFIAWFIQERDALFSQIRDFNEPPMGGIGEDVWDPMDLDPPDRKCLICSPTRTAWSSIPSHLSVTTDRVNGFG